MIGAPEEVDRGRVLAKTAGTPRPPTLVQRSNESPFMRHVESLDFAVLHLWTGKTKKARKILKDIPRRIDSAEPGKDVFEHGTACAARAFLRTARVPPSLISSFPRSCLVPGRGRVSRALTAAFLAIGMVVASTATPARAAGQDVSWPASGVVTQNAAEHRASEGGNSAIDIANPGANVPVVAAHDGVVETASIGGNAQCNSANSASNGLGNYVVIKHDGPGGPLYTAYAHLASASVSVGQTLSEGAQLGVMGNTGCSTGQHVHFAVGRCARIFSCTLWNAPDPADDTRLTQGQATGGTYPELAPMGPSPPPGEGSFVQVSGLPQIYRVAGGAPLYVSSWAPFGGPQPVSVISQQQFDALRPVPADGTFISTLQDGRVYRVAGGAPLYVSSWSAFGGPQPSVGVDQWDVDNTADPHAHLRAFPADGTFITTAQDGRVYRIAGGAPFYVSSWSIFGGVQPSVGVDQWDVKNTSDPHAHVRGAPVDGTLVAGLPSRSFWTFAAGRRQPAGANPAAVGVDDKGLAAYPVCVVPKLRGKLLAKAKRKLERNQCKVRITRRRSTRVKRGRVIGTQPGARSVLTQGSTVLVIVSRGRR